MLCRVGSTDGISSRGDGERQLRPSPRPGPSPVITALPGRSYKRVTRARLALLGAARSDLRRSCAMVLQCLSR